MIPPNFQIPLISPVGLQPLMLPRLPSASLTTVGMSAIAGPADEKHRATGVGTAKQQ
jgi:hypothetical protein